jgi:hypothetical protein
MSETTLIRIERLLDQLTFEEQIAVVEHLARRLRQAVQKQKQPQDLYGIWRDRFPADFDVDAALDDIRREWEREWPQGTGQ